MPASHDAGIHNLMNTNLKLTSKTNNPLLMRNDDTVYIVVETEDASSKQESLRYIEKKSRSNVLYFEDLIGNEKNAA